MKIDTAALDIVLPVKFSFSEDELDAVKPWIKDELAEGQKDKGAAYSRLFNRFNRRPTREEVNQELKLKPHRDKRRPLPIDRYKYNRIYN